MAAMRTAEVGKTASEPRPEPEPVPPAARTPLLVWAAMGVLCVVVLGFYLLHYPVHDLNPVGWDVHAYVWQTKAIGHGSLAGVGARPGLPLLASVLRSVIPIDPSRELVVLPPVLALMLGLAAGTVTRLAFRLPVWASAVIALVVSFWPMTSRIVFGYQASLMEQVLLAAGIGVLAFAEGDLRALGVSTALFTAGALSHIVFYLVFVAIAGLAVVTALPSFVRGRRCGVALLHTEAGAMSATILGGAVVGGAALFGWLGIRPSSSVDTTAVSFTYRARAHSALRALRLGVTVPVAMVGAALGWVSGKSRPARIVIRLGLAWLAVTVGAVVLYRAGVVIAASRFIQFALPSAVLVGVGAVAVGVTILRRSGILRSFLAAAVVLILATAPAIRQLFDSVFHRQVAARTSPVWTELRAAETYLERLPGDRPVVFVVYQRGYWGAFTPKLNLYVIRGSVPAEDVTRTFVYVGHLAELEAGQPTVLPEATKRWQQAFNATSLKMWSQAKPALDEGAVVLIARTYAKDPFSEAVAQDPGREVAPGLYVVSGPLIRIGPPIPPRPFSLARGAASAVGFLAILMLAGWGWARFALRRAGPSRLDIACVAPAIGAGLAILISFLVAALGGDPGSWPGIAALVVVGLTGAAAAGRMPSAV